MRGKQVEKGQRKERRDKGQKRKKTDKETAEKGKKKEKGKLSAPALAPAPTKVNVSSDIVYETWKASKIDTSYAIRNAFSSKMNKAEKRIMDEYEKSASFAAAAAMAHVTKSSDVAGVKKKTTNKKMKNNKKVVKKTRADHFLDDAEEWINHINLVRDEIETLSSDDAADADYGD